jgi:hypothetical protein
MFTLKSIKQNGGGTFGASGETVQRARGYQVSTQDVLAIKVRDMRAKQLKQLLKDKPEECNLGVWIDKGVAYIDYSKWFSSKKEASKIGKQLKQISIWDWKKQEAVYL